MALKKRRRNLHSTKEVYLQGAVFTSTYVCHEVCGTRHMDTHTNTQNKMSTVYCVTKVCCDQWPHWLCKHLWPCLVAVNGKDRRYTAQHYRYGSLKEGVVTVWGTKDTTPYAGFFQALGRTYGDIEVDSGFQAFCGSSLTSVSLVTEFTAGLSLWSQLSHTIRTGVWLWQCGLDAGLCGCGPSMQTWVDLVRIFIHHLQLVCCTN